jgi:hypothetical protein
MKRREFISILVALTLAPFVRTRSYSGKTEIKDGWILKGEDF